jgi:hypothetical protein
MEIVFKVPLEMEIRKLGLHGKTVNALQWENILTIDDLKRHLESQKDGWESLLRLPGIAKNGLRSLMNAVGVELQR